VSDAVDHPKHYNAHPAGIECIDVVEHMGFNLGNAIKYLWRADEQGKALEDLRKAAWYVQREIDRRTPCPTCSGPIRETTNMVCQTCGTDYGSAA
jgi:hypothetical protein